jgi:hypothetical protein
LRPAFSKRGDAVLKMLRNEHRGVGAEKMLRRQGYVGFLLSTSCVGKLMERSFPLLSMQVAPMPMDVEENYLFGTIIGTGTGCRMLITSTALRTVRALWPPRINRRIGKI